MNPANKVCFNKKFYSRKSIEAAAKIYHEFAQFKIADGGKYIDVEVDVADDEEGSEQIVDEFKNYALLLNINHADN